MARALVLEKTRTLSLRDIDLQQTLGPGDVRIAVGVVGICGSDVHYYTHGRIGPFVVTAPMVLGHEAAGTVIEVGPAVRHLRVGDRVAVEPGIPDFSSRASRLGLYNLDPALTFWATPPVHGCLTPEVVHPAALCYRLPEQVSLAEGAMIEPLAVGVQAAAKARIAPGDTALVLGAGPIGILVALAALAGGASTVHLFDPQAEKLALAARYEGIHPVYAGAEGLAADILARTEGWGVDLVFECSGAAAAWRDASACLRPGGAVVAVGMPVDPVPIDIVALQLKEARIETVFRYANVYDRAIAMLASGKLDVTPLITETFGFDQAVAAFERAAEGRPGDVKLQVRLA
jgi:D-xylulose reductase